jgi:hypothetical protein
LTEGNGSTRPTPFKRWVIVCQGFAAGIPCPVFGQYLEWYRPNDPFGKNLMSWTNDIRKAQKFDTMGAAFECYQQERTAVDPPGFRGRTIDDGRPNRPLTAFHIEVRET